MTNTTPNPVPRPLGMDLEDACDWIAALTDLVGGFRTTDEADHAAAMARRGLTVRNAADEILHSRTNTTRTYRTADDLSTDWPLDSVAFLSNPEGRPQIYRLTAAGWRNVAHAGVRAAGVLGAERYSQAIADAEAGLDIVLTPPYYVTQRFAEWLDSEDDDGPGVGPVDVGYGPNGWL